MINEFENGTAGYELMRQEYIDKHKDLRTPLVLLVTYEEKWEKGDGYNIFGLRESSYEQASISENPNLMAIFDMTSDSQYEAGLGIARTCFISVVLTVGALLFGNIADELVINPISQMITKVKAIANDPLVAT